ncbi:hypothetical protein TGAM01_v210438 [Trichoderma gamsii]|uniref:Zn(2)-C6 fungal-type domain-containing protein n=1 Tax=Trichoderma gamsii TaxID=398673 RepID=A0A2P4Z8P1_9HYPO|nr:hypothetical protein TGAM01_v210438 [Trichoderma gamsii]PON20653.1 hypothetical protein TGAM01_v210438 [Trichoderma gamsii]
MDEIDNKNTKTTNQAWRRKPRNFAPKSKLGCKTCKIRRVKCDLSRPSCLKCQSTGRTCDGYCEAPLALETDNGSRHYHNDKANKIEGYESNYPPTTINAYQPELGYTTHGLNLQNLGAFMILPVTEPAQAEAMCFFEYISIKHLNEYNPCESWRETLMFLSQTMPSVRHAAIALALIHQDQLDRHSSHLVFPPHHLQDWPPDKAALFHYNRAIQLLLNQEIGDSTEKTAITMLVCYLFICFEKLMGNYIQASKHLRGGVELSRDIDKAMLSNTNVYEDAKLTGFRKLICQVTREIRRLDMQAVMYVVEWSPDDMQEKLMSQLPSFDSAFQSLDQAADHLQILTAGIMTLRNMEQLMFSAYETPPLSWSFMDTVLEKMETWSSLFENMLQQGRPYDIGTETDLRIPLLRLQHTIARILLCTYGSGREMDFDNFLPQFQQAVALAGDVATAHERYSGSLKPTFTPEIGFIPVLYIIGVKCRDPVLRRQVLPILRRQPIREAVWDSISAAMIVERVIEIEESGSMEGRMAQSREQIAAWQRVENVSWKHVLSEKSAYKLDVRYTFCGRKGTYMDTIMI